MIFGTIKTTIIYVLSLNIILTSVVSWLVSFANDVSNLMALLVATAGLVMTYYTIIHIKTKIRGQKLDNLLKEKELNE